MAMMKDYKDFGMRMFKKGKMGPKAMFPEKVKDLAVMKKIFEEMGEKK